MPHILTESCRSEIQQRFSEVMAKQHLCSPLITGLFSVLTRNVGFPQSSPQSQFWNSFDTLQICGRHMWNQMELFIGSCRLTED